MVRWLIALIVTMIVLVAGAFVLFADDSHAPPIARPGAFYRIPDPLPRGALGTLIRRKRVTGLPAGMKGWRILYLTHGYDGRPAVVSGLVIVPLGHAPEHRRHIVAFAHGTSGIEPRCGPSVLGGAAAPEIDGLSRFIKAGDAVVVPDYQGLGTAGPHPYLLGAAAARTVIDGVRAAGNLPGAHAGPTFAVFGESQGGQAALAVADLARHYGRGLTLAGIAAAAPPTKLAALFAHSQGTVAGNVLAAFTLSSWAKIYDEPRLNAVVRPSSRRAVASIDDYCIENDTQPLSVVPHPLALRVAFRHRHPTRAKVWAALLKRNSTKPFRSRAPMLILQGSADPIVSPGVTTAYVKALCDAEDTVEYEVYPGVNHVTIGQQSAHSVADWIADRFARKTVPSSCPR